MYRPQCVPSVLTTSVKILPYRPPAHSIRAEYFRRIRIKEPPSLPPSPTKQKLIQLRFNFFSYTINNCFRLGWKRSNYFFFQVLILSQKLCRGMKMDQFPISGRIDEKEQTSWTSSSALFFNLLRPLHLNESQSNLPSTFCSSTSHSEEGNNQLCLNSLLHLFQYYLRHIRIKEPVPFLRKKIDSAKILLLLYDKQPF